MSVHQPKVSPGLNPGGLVVRSCTVTDNPAADECLVQANLSSLDGLDAIAEAHGTSAMASQLNGDVEVRLYVYDGDTGTCLKTVIVPAPSGRRFREVRP